MAAKDCIKRIQDAAGRLLTDDEVAAVFDRIHKAALDIKAGRFKPQADQGQMFGESPRQLIEEAAQKAAAELTAESDRAERNAALQVLKIEARSKDYQILKGAGLIPLEAVKSTIAIDYSGRSRLASLEQQVHGWQAYFTKNLNVTWQALGDDWLGFFQDKTKLLDLVKELRGEDSGNALAKKGAKAFHETAEEARQTFNSLGGKIGKLIDWGMPQHHGQEQVASAGGFTKDPVKAKEYWINAILPKLDLTRYVDDAGTPWSQDEIKIFLGHAWDTIATNGNSNIVPGQFRGNGGRANRHAEERAIHFKDAQSYIDYWGEFGDKTAIEILYGHVDTLARDIAFVEWGGPNPNTTYQTVRDMALTEATMAAPVQTPALEGQAVKLDNLYNYASGRTIPVASLLVTKIADGIAHLNVAGKLGGAVFASLFGDKPMMEAVSHLNNLPAIQRWQTELALLNPANAADRALLRQQGLMLEGVRSGLMRFYEGLGKTSTTGKLANAVMRITGMNAINNIRKGAFGLSLMNAIGLQIRQGVDFGALHGSDMRTLRNYGIEEADWQTWKLATLEDYGRGNDSMLTPDAIARIPDQAIIAAGLATNMTPADVRRQATVKLLGAINSESSFAIVTPGWRERAAFYADLQRGTFKGELTRSWLQFKQFPWTQFQRGMDAIANQQGGMSKAVMASYLIVATTLAGAMLQQTREILAGKDPRSMTDENWMKFWGASFVYGGALGIYGDFLYGANQNRYGSGILETVAGPTLGPLSSLVLVQPMNAIRKRIEGEETHLAAQTIASAKGFIPGNNIWYTKAAMEHLVWQRMMEQLSPGYLDTIRQRTQRDYGQDWWWQPGEVAPERAPALSEAIDE